MPAAEGETLSEQQVA